MRGLSLLTLLAVGFEFVAAGRKSFEGIVGGTNTTIERYPYVTALLYSADLTIYTQTCVGAIINNRAILSAAHCFLNDSPSQWRIRVGSTNANSGGTIYFTSNIIQHPDFIEHQEYNLAILHSAAAFVFSDSVRQGAIAGVSYVVGDNQPLQVIGWGKSLVDTPASEGLRELQVRHINLNLCRQIYYVPSIWVTAIEMCSGWIRINEIIRCQGQSGSPVLHNNVIVGVTTGGLCSAQQYPGISALISQHTHWIQANA